MKRDLGPDEQLGIFDAPALEARVAARAREGAHHLERYGLARGQRAPSPVEEAELVDLFQVELAADGGDLAEELGLA